MALENKDEDDLCRGLERVAEALKAGIEVKDRKYRLQTFKKCFIGKEAVDFLIDNGYASSRSDAVMLGQALSKDMKMFEHVLRDHDFEDEGYFYRFLDETDRGRIATNVSGWTDFLAPTDAKAIKSSLQPSFPRPDFSTIDAKDVHAISSIWPLDSHNKVLLDNVHPPNWVDPKSAEYDLVVIGAGSGGLVTAAGAAGVGAKVALIEEHLMGGDCLNVGCVPSKAIIHSANLVHTMRGNMKALEDSGISIEGGPSAVNVDFAKVMERVREIRSGISHHDSAKRFAEELGVEVFFGRGRFLSEKTCSVNGRTLNFKKAVVATGGYPTLIPMDGLKELHEKSAMWDTSNTSNKAGIEDSPRPCVMTNETFFNLTKQPEKMVVIGAGVIGLELAQSMQRLGTPVTVLGRSGKVLPKEDQDLAKLVQNQMEKDGVTFRLSVSKYGSIELTGRVLESGLPEMIMKVTEKTEGGDEVSVDIYCDALLVAAGRRPNVTGMDLEKAGIKYDTKTGLEVDDRLQTANARVYGVGDCCSEYKFTHASDFMARAVIRNALFLGKERMSKLLIPYATFTTPEIASVGLYDKDILEKGIKFKVYEKHFKDNDRAICDGATDGMVRFRVDSKSGKILGATIVGVGAGNMISEVTLAMQSGTGLGSLAAVIHPYPTTAEAVRQAGDLYNKERLTTTVKALLRGVIKAQR
mmetsp:Transcript_43508/g.132399  ORF Transcript_43508/g.132399 Transcript_43508/m.132399 type:complete len:694 (-) Transcript_43508:280-2361(-)